MQVYHLLILELAALHQYSFTTLFPQAESGSASLAALVSRGTHRHNSSDGNDEGNASGYQSYVVAVDTRLRKHHEFGLAGCAQFFAGLTDPITYKRKAAETIAEIRRNRHVCRRQCRNCGGADARLLERAAACRRRVKLLQQFNTGTAERHSSADAAERLDNRSPAVTIHDI